MTFYLLVAFRIVLCWRRRRLIRNSLNNHLTEQRVQRVRGAFNARISTIVLSDNRKKDRLKIVNKWWNDTVD